MEAHKFCETRDGAEYPNKSHIDCHCCAVGMERELFALEVGMHLMKVGVYFGGRWRPMPLASEKP